MTQIAPIHFARIMTLPEAERADLLEFLGATIVPDEQVDRLIARVSLEVKREGARLIAQN